MDSAGRHGADPGVPITEYCDRNQLATNEHLPLFVSVCQAIQHAHQNGIIDRDIQRVLNGDAVKACPPSAAYRLRKFAWKNRAVLVTACSFAPSPPPRCGSSPRAVSRPITGFRPLITGMGAVQLGRRLARVAVLT